MSTQIFASFMSNFVSSSSPFHCTISEFSFQLAGLKLFMHNQFFVFLGVVPYLPYSKQSKMRNRGAIPAKLIATMLCSAGKFATILCVFLVSFHKTLLSR